MLCLGIVGVVVLNAVEDGRRRGERSRANRYFVIAAAMVVSPLVMGVVGWLSGWEHALLRIEGTLIGLFAVFWLIQTEELWNEGLRGSADRPRPPGAGEA